MQQVLAAVSSVSLCQGIRKEDIRTPTTTASSSSNNNNNDEGFLRLVRRTRIAASRSSSSPSGGGGSDNAHALPPDGLYGFLSSADGRDPNEGPAKLGMVGGEPVFWSSRCRNTAATIAPAEGAGTAGSSREENCAGSRRRCEECTEYLLSAFMPRVRQATAAGAPAPAAAGFAAAAASGGRRNSDTGCSSEEGEDLLTAPDEVIIEVLMIEVTSRVVTLCFFQSSGSNFRAPFEMANASVRACMMCTGRLHLKPAGKHAERLLVD